MIAGLIYLGYNRDLLDAWELATGVLITCLPLLATLFTLTLPAWRRRRSSAGTRVAARSW